MSENQQSADAYFAAYDRAMNALRNIRAALHYMPAPEGDAEINWGHVGDMNRIAEELEEILPKS